MSDLPAQPGSEFLIYQTHDGQSRVQVRVEAETVWLTQRQMAELFERDVRTISEHIRNVFDEGELDPGPTIRNFRIVQTEGERTVARDVEHYNLDVIISVGYRVRSHRGTQFRIWATQRLREYLIKGFTLDDRRLAEGRAQTDYFQELLERIRAIRASERRFYQKVGDIYATAVDYDPKHPMTQTFYATVQNKLHWAIHGQTAAELIASRADAAQPNMGLTNWSDGPQRPIRRRDVEIAKNYLTEEELRRLNRLVSQYLDFAESMAERRRPMTMADWQEKLNAFLEVNEHDVLTDAGRVSHEAAVRHALVEFERFEAERRAFEAANPVSDLDRLIEETKRLESPNEEPD